MIQKPMQCIESDCGLAKLIIDNEMKLGAAHDFLHSVKNHIIELIKAADKGDKKDG